MILVIWIAFVVMCLGMYANIAQAEYPQSTTSPLAVDLDFNSKKLKNVGDLITKDPWVDVRAYGAVGDGITDDAPAIQAAINALPSGWGTVFIPQDTYKIGTTINISGRVYLVGEGKKLTTLTLANNVNADMIAITGGGVIDRGCIAHMTLSGNSSNNLTAGSGISVAGSSGLIIEDVKVRDFREHGIHITGVGWINIQTCHVEYNLKNGIYLNGPGPDGVTISNNWINDNGTTGQDYANIFAKACSSMVVTGNTIWQSKRANIRLHQFAYANIVGNFILSAPTEHIRITGGTGSASNQINITGNILHSASESGAGVAADIQLGVGVNNSCFNVTVVGNTVSHPETMPTPLAFVDEDSNSYNNLVANNNIRGAGTAINIRGTGSRKVANIPEGVSQIDTVTIGGGAAILKHLSATTTWDPPSLSNGSVAATTVTVTGAVVGDIVYASHNKIGANNVQISAHVQAANTVRVVLRNVTGGALDIASGTLRVNVWKY